MDSKSRSDSVERQHDQDPGQGGYSETDVARARDHLEQQLASRKRSKAELAWMPDENSLLRRLLRLESMGELLDVLEDCILAIGGVDGYLINLHDPTQDALVCSRIRLPGEYSSIQRTYVNYAFKLDARDANAVCFRERAPVHVTRSTLDRFSSTTKLRFQRWGMRDLQVLPLSAPGESAAPAGTVMLFSTNGRVLKATTTPCAWLFASIAPLCRVFQQLYQWENRASTLRDTEGELQELLRFISEVNNLTSSRDVLTRILREFVSRFNLNMAAVLLEEQGRLRVEQCKIQPADLPWANRWQTHCTKLRFALDSADGATSDVFLNNRHMYFGDIPSILHLPMAEKDRQGLEILEGMESFAILPIRQHARPIGVLWLGSMQQKQALSPTQLVLIQLLCDFLGSAIQNARTYSLVERQRAEIEKLLHSLQNKVESLDNLASRDRLTGLFNFGCFDEEIKRRIQTYREHPHPFPMSLIMLDVDHFKKFNDNYGHLVGNGVLQEVAYRLRKTVRDSDFVARYGGEEFAILLAKCDVDAAVRLAERIREEVANRPFVIDDVPYQVTISLGCSELTMDDDNTTLIGRADKALYQAKRHGRNRVEPPLAG